MTYSDNFIKSFCQAQQFLVCKELLFKPYCFSFKLQISVIFGEHFQSDAKIPATD